jgi:hypothetical protein
LGHKGSRFLGFCWKTGRPKSWERIAGLARLPRQTSLLLQPGFRRYAMWLTLFCVVISISLGLALGAMVVGSYEENVRP